MTQPKRKPGRPPTGMPHKVPKTFKLISKEQYEKDRRVKIAAIAVIKEMYGFTIKDEDQFPAFQELREALGMPKEIIEFQGGCELDRCLECRWLYHASELTDGLCWWCKAMSREDEDI